jgi:hypothetical protein
MILTTKLLPKGSISRKEYSTDSWERPSHSYTESHHLCSLVSHGLPVVNCLPCRVVSGCRWKARKCPAEVPHKCSSQVPTFPMRPTEQSHRVCTSWGIVDQLTGWEIHIHITPLLKSLPWLHLSQLLTQATWPLQSSPCQPWLQTYPASNMPDACPAKALAHFPDCHTSPTHPSPPWGGVPHAPCIKQHPLCFWLIACLLSLE